MKQCVTRYEVRPIAVECPAFQVSTLSGLTILPPLGLGTVHVAGGVDCVDPSVAIGRLGGRKPLLSTYSGVKIPFSCKKRSAECVKLKYMLS